MTADLETELAWKNGLFVFKQTQFDEVMRQVARWYNCEVKFEANNSKHFNASVPRNVPVSTLLDFLVGTGRVHFKVEEKKRSCHNEKPPYRWLTKKPGSASNTAWQFELTLEEFFCESTTIH